MQNQPDQVNQPTVYAYKDDVFAPLDRDHHLERIAGGNETEVYRTDDKRFVVKVKQERIGDTLEAVLAWAEETRAGAEQFAACLGPAYSIPNYYVISRDSAGQLQVLAVQPFIEHARPLGSIDYAQLRPEERAAIATQLRDIIRRALTMYRQQGQMPDLYGRSSASKSERKRLNAPHRLPWRLWSFLVQRNLLRAQNLLVTDTPDRSIIFIDYDIVRRSKLYRTLYYAVRWILFWRDHVLLVLMKRSGFVPKA